MTTNTGSENEIEKAFEMKFFESPEKRKEKIVKAVAEKLEKKYEGYRDLKNFVEYLKGIEQIFQEAESGGWEKERTKDELITSYIYLLSVESRIQEEVFKSIYADFKKTYTSVSGIFDAASVLVEKYSDKFEKEFIEYLRDVFVIFYEAEEKAENLIKTKEKIVQAKIKSLAARGLDSKKMEEICEEFKNELNKK